jgi:hypothetical protein
VNSYKEKSSVFVGRYNILIESTLKQTNFVALIMSSNLLFILSRVITALLWLPFLDVLVDAGAVRSSVRSPIYNSTGNLSSPDMRAVLTDPARQWHTDTILSFENSAQFANATERWTIFNPPTYKAAITPGSVDDVTKIVRAQNRWLDSEYIRVLTIFQVKIATSLNVPFLVTGGRHGYGITLGNLKNGLAIDLSALKSINLDKSAQTITIGPGITTGDILDIIYDAGFELRTFLKSLILCKYSLTRLIHNRDWQCLMP